MVTMIPSVSFSKRPRYIWMVENQDTNTCTLALTRDEARGYRRSLQQEGVRASIVRYDMTAGHRA